jgi:predicted enzyme involved in methoxymalonyl-ACP biosynthesis
VVIARPVTGDETVIEIDSWLMSCRVLGRRVEEGMLDALVGRARAAGKSAIRARYVPSAKNGMVSEFFDNLGFERVGQEPDGERSYVLTLAAFVTPMLPFKTT